ncbi:MAG: phytanoyl-CoA dioxygenase family protein [Verrucomicrobia bacterium]|nr:phytanoyl-CoA dioxygenase family protein [Verrucomicrobiota bacterium]MDA1086074.1 phytanoyl-CoA dioxygenase family protein [Verrucomicrobiota bacterium]
MNQANYEFTGQQLAEFARDGYVIVPGLFTQAETELLERVTEADPRMSTGGIMKDADGGESRIWLTCAEGEDICNAIARSGRILGPMEQLLGGATYIWHYKMMLKEPLVGGAWEWHQDYGYWYGDGCLFPDLASCMIAVNKATRENGCLQVLRGSNRMGRIDHGMRGGQVGANLERIEAAEKILECVYCELDPGDALFFHSNTLHCSGQNRSEHARWAFICCYNAMNNQPYRKNDTHGQAAAAEIWEDDLIIDYGTRQLEDLHALPKETL